MISNLENQLGNSYCQFEGNKKTFIVIDPNIGMLQKVSDWLENDEQSRAFLCVIEETVMTKTECFS